MILNDTEIDGAFLVEPTRQEDERGFFARIFSADEFAARGLASAFAECSIAYNRRRHTLRGLHYQLPPHEEAKLVRCTRGAVYDVIVDLRAGSPSRLHWQGFSLTAENRLALYVPIGCAHGYLTIADDTELHYQISAGYAPAAADGIRWNDPAIGIEWPAQPVVVSARDAAFPDYAEATL